MRYKLDVDICHDRLSAFALPLCSIICRRSSQNACSRNGVNCRLHLGRDPFCDGGQVVASILQLLDSAGKNAVRCGIGKKKKKKKKKVRVGQYNNHRNVKGG